MRRKIKDVNWALPQFKYWVKKVDKKLKLSIKKIKIR
jgi:hypothetical protein